MTLGRSHARTFARAGLSGYSPGGRAAKRVIFAPVKASLSAAMLLTNRSVQRALMAVILLDIPLQLDTHFGYRQDVADLGSLGGFVVSVTTVAILALYAGWIIEVVAKRNGPLAFRINWALAVYVLIAALSMFIAKDMLLASFEVWVLIESLLVFVYFATRLRSADDVVFVMRILLAGLVLESAIIIAQEAGMRIDVPGHPLGIEETTVGLGDYVRFGGTLGAPNAAGGYLSSLMAPALGLLAAPVGRWDKRLAALAFGAGFVALVFTFSRGGWTAFALSVSLMSLAMWARGKPRPKILIVVTLAILAIVIVYRGQIQTRLLEDDGGSAMGRFYLMHVAFQMIRDHPLLGVGINNFPLVMTQYFKAGDWLYTVHNQFLLIWAEVGIAGLAAFVVFLVGSIRRGWQLWKRDDPLLSILALGLTAGLIGHTSHLFVDLFRGRGIQITCLLASLIVALQSLYSSSLESPQVFENRQGL